MSKPISPSRSAPGAARPLGLCLLGALLFGILICALALLFFSWLMSVVDLPIYAAAPLASAAVCIGTAGAALLLGRTQRQNGLLWGLGTGVFFFAAHAAAALLNGQREFTSFAAIKLICILLAGCVGGYAGLLSTQHRPRRRPAAR